MHMALFLDAGGISLPDLFPHSFVSSYAILLLFICLSFYLAIHPSIYLSIHLLIMLLFYTSMSSFIFSVENCSIVISAINKQYIQE